MSNRILETERLYLREFTIADAAMLVDLHSDPEVSRYTGDILPMQTLAQCERVLREIIFPQYKNKIGRWAVFLKDGDEFMGWCGLKDVGGEIDLGYRYFKKHWGKGYATEAAKAVLDYGIRMKLPNIMGRAAKANKASVNVLQKIGLTFKETYVEEANGEESVKFVLELPLS